MMKLIFICLSLVAVSAFAEASFKVERPNSQGDLIHSPPDFQFSEGKAVFVDFQSAYYHIVFDFKKKVAFVKSTIVFYQDKPGHPLFDLHNKVLGIKIDKLPTTLKKIQPPSSETEMMLLGSALEKGVHELVIESNLTDYTGPIFEDADFLDFFFSLDDLTDRTFLEIYVPSSFEYDKVKMAFEIELKGTKTQHKVYNNGELKRLGQNHFLINFPDYFTTSSPFLHLAKVGLYQELNFSISSVAGREIPVTIYSESLETAKKIMSQTIATVKELEEVVAPWPHPALLVQVTEGGAGMEYTGALICGDDSIRHEIIHNYFARGVMPPDGRSGWIDESLTTWMENNYAASNDFHFDVEGKKVSPRVNAHSIYKRDTTAQDYWGEDFFAYLNLKLSPQGGLKVFLPHFFKKYKFQFVTTEILKKELELFYGLDLTEDFDTYIY